MRLLTVLVLITPILNAQKDTARGVSLVGIHLGGHIPFADLASRFGPDLNLGGAFLYKNKKNLVFGIESNYFFGRNVKEDVIKPLRNSDGFIVDNEGYPADLRVNERGFCAHLVIGKVLSFPGTNANSGILISAGAGYMQHKINLYDAQRKIAAVKGDLKHGYDRLSAGMSFTQFIGFIYLSENKISNFYAGIESYQGFTQSVRKLNYDTGLPDTENRIDILAGFRAGWILPLYKRKPAEFYHY